DVESHAHDSSIRKPEVGLGIESHGGGVGARAKTVTGSITEAVISPCRECLLHLNCGCGDPAVLMKLCQSILSEECDINQLDPRTTGAIADFVVAHDRNHADGELVRQSKLDVRA